MASQPKAMLFALTSPNPSLALTDFNKWYDERHAPSRATCPGVHSVCRFRLVDEAKSSQRVGDWMWLAVYELENEDALQTEEYKNARKEDGDDESKMFEFLSRRVYQLLEDVRRDDYAASVSGGRSRLMSVIGMQTSASSSSTDQEILSRYREQTKAHMSGSKGWLRSSFWQLSTAADPRTWERQANVPAMLALHEWEDSAAARESGVLQEVLAPGAEASLGIDAHVQETALLMLWRQF